MNCAERKRSTSRGRVARHCRAARSPVPGRPPLRIDQPFAYVACRETVYQTLRTCRPARNIPTAWLIEKHEPDGSSISRERICRTCGPREPSAGHRGPRPTGEWRPRGTLVSRPLKLEPWTRDKRRPANARLSAILPRAGENSLPWGRNRGRGSVLGVDVRRSATISPAPRTPSDHRPAGIALLGLLCALVVGCMAPAPAAATPALGWSTAQIPGAAALTGISCASNALCVAVDAKGNASISTNPAAGASWSTAKGIPGAAALTGISCASNALCVAVDAKGNASISTNPAAGASWSTAKGIPGATALTGISCASDTLCVAVDAHSAYVTTNPTEGAGATWSGVEIDHGHSLRSVSCASNTLCVAVDNAGHALRSGNPAAGSWGEERAIDELHARIGLVQPRARGCVRGGRRSEGDALASANPTSTKSPPTWSWTPAFAPPGTPTDVSCAGPASAPWRTAALPMSATIPPQHRPRGHSTASNRQALTGASCESEGLCAAVDNAGQVFITRVPPPTPPRARQARSGKPPRRHGHGRPRGRNAHRMPLRIRPERRLRTERLVCEPVPLGGRSADGERDAERFDGQHHLPLPARGEQRERHRNDAGGDVQDARPPLVQPHPSISGIPAPGTATHVQVRRKREQRSASAR